MNGPFCEGGTGLRRALRHRSKTASVPLNVPNNPALAGVRVQCQSATFSSGLNALGVIASNGLTLVLDLQ